MILSGSPVNSKSIFPFHPPNTGKLSMKTQNKVNVFRCKSPKKMDIKKNLLQRFLRAYRTIKAAAHREGVQPLFVTLIPRVRFKSECGCRNIPRGTSRVPSAAASPDGKKPRRRFPHTLRIFRFFRRNRSDPPTYRRKTSQYAEQFWWYGCTCPCGM